MGRQDQNHPMANREAFHTPGICGFVPGRGYRKRSPLQKVYCIWDKSSVMENELQYDPLEGPKSEEWLTIDETERIRLVHDYHRRARVRRPNEKLHAVLHVAIENQITLGHEIPVQGTAQPPNG